MFDDASFAYFESCLKDFLKCRGFVSKRIDFASQLPRSSLSSFLARTGAAGIPRKGRHRSSFAEIGTDHRSYLGYSSR